jgi:polyvinyl alcohol dehydrogenase (cytochrome)
MNEQKLRRIGIAIVLLSIAVVCAARAQSLTTDAAVGGVPDGTDVATDPAGLTPLQPGAQTSNAIGSGALGSLVSRWSAAGHDLSNTRNQPFERHIGRNNASTLTVKWVFKTEGDVSATPAVSESAVYFPDAAGNLFAVDRRTGQAIWSHKIADYTGLANDMARATPAIAGDSIILGDQAGRLNLTAGARVMAVNRRTGALLWVTEVESNPASVITQSAVVFGDAVYVGVSSIEESYAASAPGFTCCSFRGSVLALNKHTGQILWKTYVLPGSETPGYAGGAVWGSTPVVDVLRGSLYITTGNNYTVPQAILDCQSGAPSAEVKACVDAVPGSAANHFDSILSLDLRSGAIKWAHSMVPFDSWNISCLFAVPGNEDNCTVPSGEDFDFGQGAILYNVRSQGRVRQLLGAGQKSGVYWAVNPDDGSVVWSTQAGPGGSLGGFEWGSAYDGTRLYGAISNSRAQAWTLPSGEVARNGFWSALDPATGAILWQAAGTPAVRTTNQGPVSVANGVVYGGTIDRPGTMYALDASSGKTLWTFASGGSVDSGPAIVDGVVYWGSGYGVRGIGLSPNNRLYAFVPSADCQSPGSCTGAAGGGGSGGTGGSGGAGAGGTGGGGGPLPTTWTGIYNAYFATGTIGHCAGCHADAGRVVPLNSAGVAYTSLQSVGQINGTTSPLIIPGQSRLTWFGGDMPPNGPTSAPDAVQAISAWVAAGALNN